MIRPLGKTVAISVANTSSTEVTVGDTNFPDYASKVAMHNSGSTVVAVTFGTVGATPASVFPVAGTPSAANIVLPASMTAPVVFSVPKFPVGITAIGSAAGPSIIYITPCEE